MSTGDGSASFYFGHTGTVLSLFVAVGLFRDTQPLTAAVWNTTKAQGFDRQFRTSRIDPMSSNIVFTLYHCAGCQGQKIANTTALRIVTTLSVISIMHIIVVVIINIIASTGL